MIIFVCSYRGSPLLSSFMYFQITFLLYPFWDVSQAHALKKVADVMANQPTPTNVPPSE